MLYTIGIFTQQVFTPLSKDKQIQHNLCIKVLEYIFLILAKLLSLIFKLTLILKRAIYIQGVMGLVIIPREQYPRQMFPTPTSTALLYRLAKLNF